jgi:dTDP-glucose 4,6-dehydratase
VYGDPDVHPQPESYWGNVNPVGPRSVYDESKRFAEALTMAHHRTLGTDVAVARIFNTYGPRLRPDDGRVVSNFVLQALRGEPLTVYGDGSQTRDYVYVADAVSAFLAAADAGRPGTWNIGTGVEVSVLDLVDIISGVAEQPLSPRFGPPRPGELLRSALAVSRAERDLGWWPSTGLADGIGRVYRWISGGVHDRAVL